MAKPGLATTVKEKTPPDSAMRTGVIQAISGATVTVNVAGTGIEASTLDSYVPAVGDTVVLMRTEATWMILGRPVAGASNKVASGNLLGGKLFTSSDTKLSGFTSEAVVPDYSITVNMPSHNLIRILASFYYTSSNAGDSIFMSIKQDDISGQLYAQELFKVASSSDLAVGQLETWIVGDGLTSTLTLTAERFSGSGTCVIATDFTLPMVFLAEKVGSSESVTVV